MNKKFRKPVNKGIAKVPVVMQLEALECGAACLAMVLAYYGKWLPLEQVRRDCGVSRDGSNALNMLKAARHYGLTGNGYRLETEQLREKGSFPCIIHWEFDHFVVLCGFSGNNAIINDPARGTVKVPVSRFDTAFTGICLALEPGEAFEPGGHRKSMLGYALKRLSGTGSAILFVMLTAVIVSLFNVLDPAFSSLFVDRLLGGSNPGWVTPFLIGFGVFTALRITVAFFELFFSTRISGKLAVMGNLTFMEKVLRLPINFFSQRMAGDILSRQSTNASVADRLVNNLAPLVLHFGMLIFYLLAMLRYSVRLTCVGLASMLLNVLCSQIISKLRINNTRVAMRDSGKLYSTTVQGIDMIETIKASGAEQGFFEKWSGYQASLNRLSVNAVKLNLWGSLVPSVIGVLSDMTVLGLGVSFIMKGRFTPGMMLAFQGFLASFSTPANTLISTGQQILEMRTDMERIEDVFDYPDDPNVHTPECTGNAQKLSGAIEMKNVTFGYAPLGEPLIRDFSLSIRPGSTVAFVGGSGSGKSTIAGIIAGLNIPFSGSVLFDGKPQREIDRAVFTGSLAVVDQDIVLFEDTILDNIRLWDTGISEEAVVRAAKDAEIHTDIITREGGYNGRLAEGGRDLSGGQRQRIEIARVLAQDPTIIILDEATSALDAKTEHDVVKHINSRGITCIVVAHRLSTIRDADEIIVLDHGEVVERGTHAELYAKNSVYTALVSNE